jgi:hypothetical protein
MCWGHLLHLRGYSDIKRKQVLISSSASNNPNKFSLGRRVWKMGLANIRRIIHQNAVTLRVKQTCYQQNLILFRNSIRKPINQKAMWNALSISFINDIHISLVKRTRWVVVSVLTVTSVTSVLLHSRTAPHATAMRTSSSSRIAHRASKSQNIYKHTLNTASPFTIRNLTNKWVTILSLSLPTWYALQCRQLERYFKYMNILGYKYTQL